jgi:protein O-mannosyl-transferase
MRRSTVIAAILVLASLAAYWPVRRAGFTNFDDPVYVTNNPDVFRGLTWHGVAWAFSRVHGSNWHPLTWLSHMADCSLFGENAAGHHLVNVGFHVANTILLFLLLRRITGAVWRSGFVAALFALHPLHVESVAWISERKDVLSTLFGFLALWAYAGYVEKSEVRIPKPEGNPKLEIREAGGRRQESIPGNPLHASHSAKHLPRFTPHAPLYYLLSLCFFALGLMSKPMLVTVPFVLLLLDYWPLQRFQLNTQPSTLKTLLPLLREKLPFFVLAALSSTVTFWAQKTGGAVVTMQKMPLADRLANASISYLEYLMRTFWPARLAAYYPFSTELPETEAILGALLLVGVTVLALALARRAPYLAVGWLWFAGTLVPVIGLVQVGSQAMADRYTYLPLVGLFVALVWGVTEVTARWRRQQLALGLVGGSLLAACFVCTRFQVGYWQNSITLFSHAIQVTGDNALAQHNLGHALSHKGQQDEAIQHLDEAIRIKPGYPQAYFNRGNAYGVQGKLEQAIADYREAIHFKPDYEQAYCNLGKALALQNKLEEARTNFLAALRCKPDYAEAHTKLGNVLVLQGNTGEALEHLHTAVRIQPDYDEGQYFLGAALVQQKKFPEAAACLRAAIQANPRYASALNDLGWLLATCPDAQVRNVPEAIRCAKRGCELVGNADPKHLDTLAVAQSEAGQFTEASVLTEKAIGQATAAGDSALAAQLQAHLNIYRAGHSFTQGGSAAVPNSGR